LADVAIASLNLHCGVGTRGPVYDVAAVIQSLDAPVILVQETWSPDAPSSPDPVEVAARALGAELFRMPVGHTDNLKTIGIPRQSGPGTIGIALLSCLPAAGYEVFELGDVPGDTVTRRAQIVTLELSGGAAVRLAGTHLTHRLTSPLQLGRLIRHLSGSTIPTVIAGDLNMPRHLARLAPGYSATVRGRTWPAELPLVQLDHVLISRGLRQTSASVLPAAGSDHLPVRVSLRLDG
jgi:endonuclease/exonuclease/phosphatase family metal-dependent hydrolase